MYKVFSPAAVLHRFQRTLIAVILLALPAGAAQIEIRVAEDGNALSVYRSGADTPILTQHTRADFRPYIHPIQAPDGDGVLTEYSPGHHTHQTGLYWGLKNINGRDFFHNPGATHWKRFSVKPIVPTGDAVQWETVYQLLDEDGGVMMAETQRWTVRDADSRYYLNLNWTGMALQDLTIGQEEYGGLFLRMPWSEGIGAEAVNSARQRDSRAEGQRAMWLDVGMDIEGREDRAHIAIFDHPDNDGYPLPWRVDGQFGFGPAPARGGPIDIPAGENKTYRHQLVVYTGGYNDIHLSDEWSQYSGSGTYAQWLLAREEARRAEFLTGEQAIEKMTMPDGLEVRLFAGDPEITQPIAFCWDDKGRLWVAENRDYESRGGGFSGDGDSRILILEDTDGDGRMDVKKTFLDGIPFPSAIAWGFSGLWLGAPPNLLFVPDRDGDDRADDDIEVRLAGWGIRDRHEVLNSLNWGPDGWLYGCQGYATPSKVGKPAGGGHILRHGDPFPEDFKVEDGVDIDGGVWRYHPTKDRFEVVAHGFSNPWGLDFDDHGQIFISACVIPHLWHVIPGGTYHRQGGTHFNPYVYDDIKTIADHRHRSAHGGARVYLADALPEKYRDRIFMANIHEHALLSDKLEPRGSGFVGTHGDDTLLANDPQWIGFSLEIGPEGAVYILDWHDADICGNSVQDKDTGRIYRLAPEGMPGVTGLNVAAKGDLELVALQSHTNDWYVRRARLILQERAHNGTLEAATGPALWQRFETADTPARKLRALWALHVCGLLNSENLAPLLGHATPEVRAWAIQLLCEDHDPGSAATTQFIRMAAEDPSPVVRLYLASALQRISDAPRWEVATALTQHTEDIGDHNLPKMIWFGVEPLVPGDPDRALRLAANAKIPLVTQYIARRAAAAGALDTVTSAAQETDDATRTLLLTGMRDGLRGRRDTTAPANWAALEAELLNADANLRDLALDLGQRFGSERARQSQLAMLANTNTPLDRRRDILKRSAEERYAPALDTILALTGESSLRRDAIRALAAFDDGRIPDALLDDYADFADLDKRAALDTLTARESNARRLLAALQDGRVPRADIPAHTARKLEGILGADFTRYWGTPVALAAGQAEALRKYLGILEADDKPNPDPRAGRLVYDELCGVCHTIYGQGALIGPDITGADRTNPEYLLENILNPSGDIPQGYELINITTDDGRLLSGVLAGEDDAQVTLRLIGQDVVVPKSEIASREQAEMSMMPLGLLEGLSEAQIRDLFAYLGTLEQVPLPY